MAEDVIELARRFEPILHFHTNEQFHPSDAKRYLEHCALWKAERPFNEKNSWGGKIKSFPRQPMIAHQKIAASNDEAQFGDTYLGEQQGSSFPFITDTSNETRFLELAGWTRFDPEIIEGVDESSENRYASLRGVFNLYNGAPGTPLPESVFWYHAELFDTERLRGLMSAEHGVPATLSLWDVFASLTNPALLCYYFFFPGHREELPPPCDSETTGLVYASFGGEWACMAILLERRTENEKYRPTWIGHTGRRNVGTLQGLDFDLRIGMTAQRWKHRTEPRQDPLPRTVEEHPKLYVARGTHSLYLDQGTHIINPYPAGEAPQWCGRFDTPGALENYLQSKPPKKSASAAWAKILGGLLLGGVWGALAGAVLTALEGLPLGEGISAVGQQEPSSQQPDLAPGPGDFGIVLHPQDITLTEPTGANFVEWKSDANLVIGSRKYTSIVDRATQIWWPSDDGKSGYRGRWGPLVTNDPLGRRAGMRFPEFWRMFFVALAKQLSK
jgi:hypothetical protein